MHYILPILLLVCANVFMTFAWYGHLKLNQMGISTNWPLIAIILFSWGIAFVEYCFQVPANRIGFVENGGPFSLMQLKVIQEAISIFVFCEWPTSCSKAKRLPGTTSPRSPALLWRWCSCSGKRDSLED